MKFSKAQRKAERIRKHGDALLRLFPNAEIQDGVQLCNRLRRIESEAERHAVGWCNADGAYRTMTEEQVNAITDKILAKVVALLNPDPSIPIFINTDPRGYQLKIDDEWIRKGMVDKRWSELPIHTDWGGYGILAPDFNED